RCQAPVQLPHYSELYPKCVGARHRHKGTDTKGSKVSFLTTSFYLKGREGIFYMLIKQQFVLSRLNTYGGGNPCRFITIHETGNFSRGADAQAHANLQSRGYSATWHYQVDDEQIIQSFPDDVRCWHAGDGRGKGNRESIAIEICVHPDGNFVKAVKNAAHLVVILMNKHDIPIENVVQHHHWSKKNCPQLLRAGSRGVTWTDFIKMVKRKIITRRHPQTYKVNKVLNGYY